MVEYSCVFNHGDYKFMLYNGNDYGKNGIGYAVKIIYHDNSNNATYIYSLDWIFRYD